MISKHKPSSVQPQFLLCGLPPEHLQPDTYLVFDTPFTKPDYEVEMSIKLYPQYNPYHEHVLPIIEEMLGSAAYLRSTPPGSLIVVLPTISEACDIVDYFEADPKAKAELYGRNFLFYYHSKIRSNRLLQFVKLDGYDCLPGEE